MYSVGTKVHPVNEITVKGIRIPTQSIGIIVDVFTTLMAYTVDFPEMNGVDVDASDVIEIIAAKQLKSSKQSTKKNKTGTRIKIQLPLNYDDY